MGQIKFFVWDKFFVLNLELKKMGFGVPKSHILEKKNHKSVKCHFFFSSHGFFFSEKYKQILFA